MHTLQQQIDFIQRIAFADLDPDSEYYRSILNSLEKLKAQEDLIDQQADELKAKYESGESLTPNADKFISSSMDDMLIDAMSKEIAEIKDVVFAIADKFNIQINDVKLNAEKVIEEFANLKEQSTNSVLADIAIAKLMPIDPAIKLLLGGDPSEMEPSKILMLYGQLTHDISILEELFDRGGMTVGERDGILDNTNYKTTDLNLLQTAATLLSSYLPF